MVARRGGGGGILFCPATDTDGDQHDSESESSTMRANHAVPGPISTPFTINIKVDSELAIVCRSLPRPMSFKLDLESHAQEGTDQDDEAEDSHILKRRIHGYCANDVCRNQKFQS